jgi:exodeoxyribonuclease V alpha subunit
VVTAVGAFTNPAPGESLLLFGQWTTHPQYGPQFRMERYQTLRPATLVGIERYLGSGLIKGVGPVTAKRLVKHFGTETLEVIEHEPERLSEVPGVGHKRITLIAKAWKEQKEVQNIMLFLQGHGVSTAFAVRIYKNYGDRSLDVVQQNPYRLTEIWGIGFKSADRIAQALGLPTDAPARLEAGLLHVLNTASEAGHCFLPRQELLDAASEELGIAVPGLEGSLQELLIREAVIGEEMPEGGQPSLYVPSLYHTERGVAQRLQDLLALPPTRDLGSDDPQQWCEAWMRESGLQLSDQQRQAVLTAVSRKALLLTGGPGTGKTTTTRAIVGILESLGRRVVLASPTGRAAKRLSEVTGYPAKTIHRLLEFDPSTLGFKRGPDLLLECDAVLVDEVSMLDVVLFYSLLKAIPLRARLILVGDSDQLPSVGPGNVLRDLLASEVIPTVRLTQVFRQAAASLIVTNAHRVNQGEMPELISPKGRTSADCLFLPEEDPEKLVELVSAVVRTSLPKRGFPPQEIQVLCPMNRGTVGSGHLNRVLQDALNPRAPEGQPPRPEVQRAGRTFRLGDRVLQLVNNYTKGVFNGDVGTVSLIDEEEQVLVVTYPDQEVNYDFADVDELQLAYALSVHKSQGSEYPAVVIPIHTQHYVMLQRNLVYTALTRGKRLVTLLGSKRALAMAIRNNRETVRYTRLAERLGRA